MRRMPRAKIGMNNERGFSILEALIASMIMIIGVSGLMALFAIAAAKNAGQGNQATRCTEYAQDKMEQLLALPFTDGSVPATASEVVGSNTICSTCTGYSGALAFGLGGATANVTYGVATTIQNNALAGYMDYVNNADLTNPDGISGALTCAGCAGSAQYMRTWQIANTSATVKTITVTVKALFTADTAQGLAPNTTLIAVKQPY